MQRLVEGRVGRVDGFRAYKVWGLEGSDLRDETLKNVAHCAKSIVPVRIQQGERNGRAPEVCDLPAPRNRTTHPVVLLGVQGGIS